MGLQDYSEEETLILEEPLISKNKTVYRNGEGDEITKATLGTSTANNAGKNSRGDDDDESDTAASSSFVKRMYLKLIKEKLRRKGDQQRKLFNFLTMLIFIAQIVFIYYMRHTDWTKTYLVTETIDYRDHSVIMTNTSIVLESGFHGVKNWWSYGDGFFLFAQLVKVFMNILPSIKVSVGLLMWLAIIAGPAELRRTRNGRVLVVNSFHRGIQYSSQSNEDGTDNNVSTPVLSLLSKVFGYCVSSPSS